MLKLQAVHGLGSSSTVCRGASTVAPSTCSRASIVSQARTGRDGRRLQQLQQVAGGPFYQPQQQRCSHVCRATIDEPEIQELVQQLKQMTPDPPAQRPQLEKAIALIDEVNAQDPTKVPTDSGSEPYRLAYSRWLTEWVKRLDPKASDELLILARGKSIESWQLSQIKRDDYAPNTPGMRQWEMDRKKWLANRLLAVVKEAGYDEATQTLIENIMMGKNLPDPRDVRKYDLIGNLGMVDFKKLQAVNMMQTLDDAEALLFLEKNFEEMFNRMPADEVAAVCKRELSRLSQNGIVTVLKQRWSPVQQRLLQKVLPVPGKFASIMMDVEGVSAASTHPGDWRYANFDYE